MYLIHVILNLCYISIYPPTPVFLPGESQGWGSLVACHLWGRTESDTTQQQQQYIPIYLVMNDLQMFQCSDYKYVAFPRIL